MSDLGEGYVHVYTGNGKGKTTAAIGLAIRAAGAGLKSFIAQFMKVFPYGELDSLSNLKDYIKISQFVGDEFVLKKEPPSEKEIEEAERGLSVSLSNMLGGEFDIIILDEILVAIYFKLFAEEEILRFIDSKPKGVELVLTGRYCPESIITKADLVTEMKEIKHYYADKGITSRRGIDS